MAQLLAMFGYFWPFEYGHHQPFLCLIKDQDVKRSSITDDDLVSAAQLELLSLVFLRSSSLQVFKALSFHSGGQSALF